MTPNASAAEQSAAIKQAQQQAAQLLAVDGQSSPIGAVASLIGTTPRPQVTKPTSVGPLPVHPVVSVTPPPPPNPLPSYHSLLDTDEQDQQGEEEVAVEEVDAPDHSDETHTHSDLGKAKEDGSDFSSQSFLERLFPEMV
ncbi:uncharacterized protein LOC117643512 [Thrips palmi]|uniref:Uncharacterized protein LOC117643512 n=1 Tax=Thrips palmi TaxID=161013 RepID=A0A6P8YNB6_THRPL|nr:uncharacterized protein LOC117643512 [Thrips palmi]